MRKSFLSMFLGNFAGRLVMLEEWVLEIGFCTIEEEEEK